jgi:hypothetical protein
MNNETTISLNGGPAVTLDVFKTALDIIKKKPWRQQPIQQDGKTISGGYPVSDAKAFFAEVADRETQISELKAELKEAIDSYATCNNMTSKGIKKGLKEYKDFLKSEAEFRVTDSDADNLFEQLAS